MVNYVHVIYHISRSDATQTQILYNLFTEPDCRNYIRCGNYWPIQLEQSSENFRRLWFDSRHSFIKISYIQKIRLLNVTESKIVQSLRIHSSIVSNPRSDMSLPFSIVSYESHWLTSSTTDHVSPSRPPSPFLSRFILSQ